MSTTNEVVIKTVSDLHFSHTAPDYRSNEPDWYKAMQRMTNQLWEIDKRYPDAIWVYPGDIFNVYNPCPELINWVSRNLPHGYGIPGQHDLPHHRYQDRKKSGYQTLCDLGVIHDLPTNVRVRTEVLNRVYLYGFPWGAKIEPRRTFDGDCLHIAVVHANIWNCDANKHNGATEDQAFLRWVERLRNYNTAIFGDNHHWFKVGSPKADLPHVLNNGTFMIRHRSDPKITRYGLVRTDGSVFQYTFDQTNDVFVADEEVDQATVEHIDTDELSQEIEEIVDKGIDFALALINRARSHPKYRAKVDELLQDFLENG